MASLGTLFGVDVVKLVRRPMTWVLAAILVAFVVLVYVAVILAARSPAQVNAQGPGNLTLRETLVPPHGFGFGLDFASQIGIILLIILTAGAYGSEFSWGTLRTTLLMGGSRLRVLIAKFLLLVGVAILVTIFAAAVGVVGSLVARAVLGVPPGLGSWPAASDAALMALRAFIAIGMWMLIASALTVLTRSLAVGLGLTLALNFIGGFITTLIAQAGTIGRYIARLFPNEAIAALTNLNGANPPHYTATDYAWIIANLVIYAVVLSALAIVRMQRMNVITSE